MSDRAGYALITILLASVFGGLIYTSADEQQQLTPFVDDFNQTDNRNNNTMTGLYIVYQGSLLSSGEPNAVAERLVDASNTYGLPIWVEVTTAYPWGEINNALVDYFHSADINVSARVWSEGGSNPLATIESQIDQVLAWASNVDMIMIDECNGDMYDYLDTLSAYVHGKGKLIAFNMAGYDFSESFIPLADHINTEFWWRDFIAAHSDWLVDYPNMFGGEVNDWGYSYLGYPEITVDLTRGIADTQEAWNAGMPFFYATTGEGFTLPSWFEDYLEVIVGSATAVQTPTFNPVSGTYGETKNVTITSATSGATIYYTDNGDTPTSSSTEYSTPVAVAASKTLKALATKTGYTDSAIGSASYIINNPVTPSPIACISVLYNLRRH